MYVCMYAYICIHMYMHVQDKVKSDRLTSLKLLLEERNI